ncbi:MAG: enoyl-CoA hydratase-related protein [Ideonella sp.]|nr:enoyl-CoA hydratase-related protein [Ideonella sp.]
MTIRTAVIDGVATIEIARPEKKNALTVAMYAEMAQALRDAQGNGAVRAVLITGQPGIFTAGNDLEDFMQRPRQGADSPVFQFMRALLECDKPVVAAVTGAARLAMPFTSLGLVAEFASSLVVPALMGNVRAAEKLLLGDPFTAEQAVECGIANAVLPAGEVVAHARRVAERFNALPPGAVRDTKKLMRQHSRQQVLAAIASEGEVFGARLSSPEAREAFSAFFQKRKPDFSSFT